MSTFGRAADATYELQQAGLASGRESGGAQRWPEGDAARRRHAFASEMAYLGLDADDVMEVLGHTTRAITEAIYTHAFNRDKREARIRE